YAGIHSFLRRDMAGYGLEDDMDITLCKYDSSDNSLLISGMGNHVFLLSNGTIEDIRPDHLSDDPFIDTGYNFSSSMRFVMPGDTLYLFSDGFADQFGGKNNKRYQKTRLRKYLAEIKEHPLPGQNDMLYEEIEKWRLQADAEQTDDISAIGIRF
ncbi:MAG TPA: SpoIIE family protein phosphatase, partial [Bacteroidales bacterium]|nr:SpoIIE family protein phosphatase [Bacteroidales bacterium]